MISCLMMNRQSKSFADLASLTWRALITFSLVLWSLSASAQSSLSDLMGETSEVLDPDVAFVLEVVPTGDNRATATILIEDEHYLYREKTSFLLPNEPDVKITVSDLTPGKLKHDDFFGEVEVNRKIVTADLLFEHQGASRNVELNVIYQGCADLGICYPPQTKVVNFTLAEGNAGGDVMAAIADAGSSGGGGSGDPLSSAISAASSSSTGGSSGSANIVGNVAANSVATTAATSNTIVTSQVAANTASASGVTAGVTTLGLSEQDKITNRLGNSSLPVIIALFVGLGVLLAFTPCVLPMVPILSGLIVGQGEKVTTARATMLSVIYVLVMALTYAVAGVLVAKTGAGTGFLQNPYILSAFAAILAILSLSMFGFYELQMPVALQNRLNNMSNSQNGGSVTGVAVMGFLSALIVGPCVTAPLVGALVFIADTGNALVGGTALFALGIGMGIPLILVGASCGKWLPKAGIWMDRVKAAFGVMLLGLAIWMLSRFVPASVTMMLAAALVIVTGIYMGALDSLQQSAEGWRRLSKGAGVIALVYGASLLVGALAGGHSLMTPLKGVGGISSGLSANSQAGGAGHAGEAEFIEVKGLDNLNEFVKTAGRQGQPLILDFYADWCVSCKEMEAFTFTDPAVSEQMNKAILVQADVTKNDKLDKALLKEFGLFGPPAILFFSPNGEELRNGRVVGFMNKEKFHQHLLNVYGNMGFSTQTAQVPGSDASNRIASQ